VPPHNSVAHLHLHCFALPFHGFNALKYMTDTPWCWSWATAEAKAQSRLPPSGE
jgi:hypothetical protein